MHDAPLVCHSFKQIIVYNNNKSLSICLLSEDMLGMTLSCYNKFQFNIFKTPKKQSIIDAYTIKICQS